MDIKFCWCILYFSCNYLRYFKKYSIRNWHERLEQHPEYKNILTLEKMQARAEKADASELDNIH